MGVNQESIKENTSISEKEFYSESATSKARRTKKNSCQRGQSPKRNESEMQENKNKNYYGTRKRVPMNNSNEVDLLYLINFATTDIDAISNAAKQDPQAARRCYFSNTSWYCSEFCKDGWYPIHQAIMSGASCDVVDVLYKSYPRAIEKRIGPDSALSLACKYSPFPEVALYLLEKWPKAATRKDRCGNTLLHYACSNPRTSSEVVSFLLHRWPDAAKERDNAGETPLYKACQASLPLDVVSLLLRVWPDAVKETCYEETPLYVACCNHAQLSVILLLLEKWPDAVKQQCYFGETPLSISQKNDSAAITQKVIWYVSQLCGENVDRSNAEEAMQFFIEIKWHGGIAFVINNYPDITLAIVSANKVPLGQLVLAKSASKRTYVVDK